MNMFYEIQKKAAEQCAPVIYGIKPSNLLIIDRDISKKLKALIRNTDLKVRCFYNMKGKQVWFLYREAELQKIINQPENRGFILACGYDQEMSMNDMLIILARRFSACRNHEGEFPHELGIFLGYPLGDVKGFIVNKGQKYLYSGYWKVYENEQKAKETFRLYETVKKAALEIVGRGGLLETAYTYQYAV